MKDKKLTVERSMAEFKKAYRAKRKLIERQKEDFLFRFGKQWDQEKYDKLKEKGISPVTDNRVQPNIFLLTGLERQNRSDFKAFPEGEEDSIKAEIASALFKNAIKSSDFSYKASESFEDGVTCGESNLELYLDNTENLLNGKPCWKKIDANCVFPEPGYREYDYSDARFVYKLTQGLSKEDLLSLFPDKESLIENAESGKLNLESITGGSEAHLQKRDYPKAGSDTGELDTDETSFDLLERFYKKWVTKTYVGDWKTGEIKEAETSEKAQGFVDNYKLDVEAEMLAAIEARKSYERELAMAQALPPVVDELGNVASAPLPHEPAIPEPRDPERFRIITRMVPEIWYFAHFPGATEPLADERAWFYPNWKSYPLIPYMARFSTAPVDGDDRHLLVQGIVHGVKDAQRKHNSSETLMLLHLNGAANSGWLTEEDAWVDSVKVEKMGATPSVNLEYKTGKPKPERIFPMTLSQGHLILSQESAEAIKAQLGINADLLAVQEGSSQSGRAIALRQRQGLLMVQQLFDNFSRTKQIAGRFLLSQLGEIYDTETAKKVLGEAFLKKNFPPMTLVNPETGQEETLPGQDGNPMEYDAEMAEIAIAEVLKGDLGKYDVAVGEAVASETMKMANSAELQEFATKMPGLIPPDLLIEESQLPQSTKNRILGYIKSAQATNPLAAIAGGQDGAIQ